MGTRLRGVILMVVVLVVGAFLGSALGQWWSPPAAPEPVRKALGGWAGPRIRVEVLNGGGLEGMAHAATDQLRGHGFDVVFYGNADTFERDSSVVLDRVGRPDLARAVADAMGIRRVLSEPDSNLYLDVSVVLGREWEPAPDLGTADATGPGPTSPWWDLRRFFDDPRSPIDSGPGRMADPGEGQGT